jgi:hypothetical protein
VDPQAARGTASVLWPSKPTTLPPPQFLQASSKPFLKYKKLGTFLPSGTLADGIVCLLSFKLNFA